KRFVYVLEGELNIGGPGSYVYQPAEVIAATASRAAVIEKEYVAIPGVNGPGTLAGREAGIMPRPLGDDPDLEVRVLLPENPAFDFAVNTMTFRPGAALPMVEIHVMEHGLVMLEGGGIYRLGEHWYPV